MTKHPHRISHSYLSLTREDEILAKARVSLIRTKKKVTERIPTYVNNVCFFLIFNMYSFLRDSVSRGGAETEGMGSMQGPMWARTHKP